MISLRHVSCQYRFATKVFDDLNLEFKDGEIVCVLGDAESGKTTLFNMIIGMQEYQGEILFDGFKIHKKPDEIIAIHSNPALFKFRSVAYNIGYPLRVRKVNKSVLKSRVERTAQEFELDKILHKKTYRITEEEKCKIVLSRLEIRDAKYYLIDDIFSGKFGTQFSKLFSKVAKLAIKHKNEGKNVIFFTRNREFVEKIADKLLIVANHETREFGEKNQVINSPKNVYSVIGMRGQENIITCDIQGRTLVDRMGHLKHMYTESEFLPRSVYLYILNEAIENGDDNTLKVRRVKELEDGTFRHVMRNGMIIIREQKYDEIQFNIDLSKCMFFDIMTGLRVR